MKHSELKKGMKVFDCWYPEWGTGKVDKVTATRVYVNFPYPKGFMTYDKSHTQFLVKGKSFV